MQNAQKEEFKHFSMDLEWLFRAKPEWREIAQGVLFQKGDIVEHGEEAEEKAWTRFSRRIIFPISAKPGLVLGIKAIQFRAIDVEHADKCESLVRSGTTISDLDALSQAM